MIRIILALLLVAVVGFAHGQPVTRDCVTLPCTIVSDALTGTPGTAPTLCRLYSGATQLMEVAVIAPYACSFTRNFASGPWSVTARYANATSEGADSNVLAFTSAVPPPPLPLPNNLRFQ